MAGHRHGRRSNKLAASQPFSYLLAFKLLILLSSLVSLPIACLYLYPFLRPPFSSTIARLSTYFSPWLTPRLLFLLTNLVVCALVASSGLLTLHHPGLLPRRGSGREQQLSGKGTREELESHNPRPISVPQRPRAHRPHFEQQRAVNASTHVDRNPVSPPAVRLGRSKSGKALANTKANSVLPPLQVPKKTQTSKPGPPNELRKASANALPSEETSDRDEELNDVDRRADEYIVEFYKKMRLQRIESFKRARGQIDRSL